MPVCVYSNLNVKDTALPAVESPFLQKNENFACNERTVESPKLNRIVQLYQPFPTSFHYIFLLEDPLFLEQGCKVSTPGKGLGRGKAIPIRDHKPIKTRILAHIIPAQQQVATLTSVSSPPPMNWPSMKTRGTLRPPVNSRSAS